jgi:CDP-diacylglycerol--glycerol-3-phosphate 3-phosphatidyltransferase
MDGAGRRAWPGQGAALGKLKTIVQMTAISCLIFREPFLGLPIFLIGEWLLFIAAALTLWSGADYLRAAWPTMRKRG